MYVEFNKIPPECSFMGVTPTLALFTFGGPPKI